MKNLIPYGLGEEEENYLINCICLPRSPVKLADKSKAEHTVIFEQPNLIMEIASMFCRLNILGIYDCF